MSNQVDYQDTEDQKDTVGDDLPRQARESFARHKDNWADIKTRADECMKCLSKDGPWPEAEIAARNQKGQERPCLHEDVLTQYVNKVINQAQASPLGYEVVPDGDGATEQESKFVEGRLRHVDYESNAILARETGLESAVMQSIGVWEIETDWDSPPTAELPEDIDSAQLFKQKINTLAAPNTWAYLLDSDSVKPDWSDMKEAFKLTRISWDEFKEQYPKAVTKSFEGFGLDYADWIDKDTIQLAVWWRVEKGKEREALLVEMKDGSRVGVWADELSEDEQKQAKIILRRMVETKKVMKRLTNGVEILKEKEHPDYEVPILVTTGRVKYENGKRVIESLIYKAITGQLLYDYNLSSMQEEINRAAKTKEIGYEGSFNTSTNWERLHREPVSFAEVAIVYDNKGERVERPWTLDNTPNIQALLEAKQSILIGIQNAIGMSSQERTDRTAKSGKAIESLEQTMQVATYHFINNWKTQINREGRIKLRLQAKIEPEKGKVSVRSRAGKHGVADIPPNAYEGRHTLMVTTGKAFESIEDKKSDVFEGVAKSNNQVLALAALPELIRMQLGDEGEGLAVAIESVQPAEMQQARQRSEEAKKDPATVQAQMQARLTQVEAAHKQLMQVAQQQKQVIDTKQVEANAKFQSDKYKADTDAQIETKKLILQKYKIDMDYRIALTKVNADAASTQAELENEAMLRAEDHALDFDTTLFDHHSGMNQMGAQQAHDASMAAVGQQHEAGMARMGHQQGMEQLGAQQGHEAEMADRAAQMAQESQGEQ